MINQNINNNHPKQKKVKLDSRGYFDLTLSNDDADFDKNVIYSDEIIGLNDGNILPIHIDLNSTDSSQKLPLTWNNYNPNNTIISKNYYNPDNEDFTCLTATTLCDIGLTGIDNGLYDSMTGETLTFFMGVNEDKTFDPHYYDRRFKMHQVGTYANSPNYRLIGNEETVYNVVSKTDSKIGYYNELYGGFYQGFYKLHGYDYEVFPERVPKGWTAEMLLKPRQRDEFEIDNDQVYLNDVYPDNAGTFFFFGARAENKFFHPACGSVSKNEDYGCQGCNVKIGFLNSDIVNLDYERVTCGMSGCTTCACADTGVTNSDCLLIYPQTATTVEHRTGGCGAYTTNVPKDLEKPANDTYSNALSVRFSGDPANPRVCVKYLTLSGGCVTSGTCETSGFTYCSGYTINEVCSERGIYDMCDYDTLCPSGTTERWVMMSIVFERYETLEDCDLLNWGGLGDIRFTAYPSELNGSAYNLIMPPFTHPGAAKEILGRYIEFNQKWIDNIDRRRGRLKIYVNGFMFMVIEGFEEIIPHELNTEREKQLGVPFNISFGGGTQGLRESLIPLNCSGATGPYIQDPELMSDSTLRGNPFEEIKSLRSEMILEPNFGGTFMGGISQFRMYTKSLGSPEIQHNFRLLKDKFDLFDYWCPACSNCYEGSGS